MVGDASVQGAERIQAPILVPLMVAVALLIAGVTGGVSWLVDREDDLRMGRTMHRVEALLSLQIEEDGEALDIALDDLVRDRGYADALQARDFQRLRSLVTPIYQHLRDDHRITHFYVTDRDRITLLRAHDPELAGDRIDRLTMRQAQATGRSAVGLELGPLGTLTLRRVLPYRADGGQVLGYFELGEEIGHIIGRLHNILGVDLVVLIDKRRLNAEGWEIGHRLFHWPLDWDRLPAVAMADGTLTQLPEALIRHLATAEPDGQLVAADLSVPSSGADKGSAELSVGPRRLHVASLPLTDSAGDRVGSVVVVADQTSLVARSRLLIAGVGILCLLVGGILLVVFSRIVGRVERRVRGAMGSLARTNADMERLAYVACHDLQEPVEALAEAAQGLAHRHQDCLAGDGRQLLETVVRESLRVRETVETLEDYLDLDINARREPVSLDAVVTAAIEKLGARDGNAHFRVEPLPVLRGRPVPLAHAVFRLVQAALDPLAVGRPRNVHIAAAGEDGWWRIAFSDDGQGDSPERRDAIREARMVAELHGGELLNAVRAEGGRTVTLVLQTADP